MKKGEKMNKKVAFYTLGCKVNQYESNAMKQLFLENNYEIVDFEKYADVYVVNTCTVTNMSDRKSRQIIRRAKQINENAILVATGCYVQVSENEVEKINDIDIILGNNEKKNIINKIKEYEIEKEKNNEISSVMYQKEFVEFGNTTYTDKTRAVIKIQDGCDRFCSYCIIPYARGRVRSRKMENIIQEIEIIAKNGIKEVVITGIQIAAYGKDFSENISLIDLLEKINKVDNIERIRLGSLEPNLITKEFVNRLKMLDKICNHFHLSLQSGCDETLTRMNRRYNTDEFKKCVKLLRDNFDDVILTADIIVGFPGETENEFLCTYNFLQEIKFYKMHIFKYSPRKGTKAAIMENQIDAKVKEERSQKLINLSNNNQMEYNKKYIGRELNVLFEEKEGEWLKGHTSNFIMVKVKSKNELENMIVKVKIENNENEYLLGKVI